MQLETITLQSIARSPNQSVALQARRLLGTINTIELLESQLLQTKQAYKDMNNLDLFSKDDIDFMRKKYHADHETILDIRARFQEAYWDLVLPLIPQLVDRRQRLTHSVNLGILDFTPNGDSNAVYRSFETSFFYDRQNMLATVSVFPDGFSVMFSYPDLDISNAKTFAFTATDKGINLHGTTRYKDRILLGIALYVLDYFCTIA